MQDVLPVVASPPFWTIVFALCIVIALRCMCFPCTTLRGLEQAVAEVDQLFKEYQMDPLLHLPTHIINAQCIMEYEEELLR